MAEAGFRPYWIPIAGGNSGLDSGFASGRRWCARARRKAWTMKHIAGTVLAVGCLALVGGALLAGKDDIRKFHRMLSM
jgi:hypothetical protein